MWCNLDCFFHMHVTYIFVEIFRVSLQIIAWVSTMPHIEVKKTASKQFGRPHRFSRRWAMVVPLNCRVRSTSALLRPVLTGAKWLRSCFT